MKHLFAFFLFLSLFFSQNINAQTIGTSNADLWLTQISEAKHQAKTNDQAIVMVFSGSDWCRPCMNMKQRVLDHKDFTSYAEEHVVLMEVDFPRRSGNQLSVAQQKHNKALAQKYGIRYFPTMVVVNAEGKEIDRIGYQASMSAADYVKYLKHRTKKR